MSQFLINNTGGSGGITDIIAGTFIDVSGSGDTRTISSQGPGIYVSPEINFKNTGLTTLFTTANALNFYVTDVYILIDSSTDAVQDGLFNIGWTGPNYSNLILNQGDLWPNQPGDQYNVIDYEASSFNRIFIPPSTAVICNITSGDTGTAQTGRLLTMGFYA